MAQFLRGKQAGIQRDFSAGLDPQRVAIDLIARYGINSQISTLAYDPVQSLLAVGTAESQYGSGQIYIFGQARVYATLTLPRKASVKILQFCADKILSVDSKNELAVYSLPSTRIIASYSPPSHITTLLTDPVLDYALLGLQNGEIVSYDMDREGVAPFRISNLWREQNPRTRMMPVTSMAFHPRDIGSLLIGYSEGAVIFSFQSNKATKFFRYEVPAGALGGDSDPASASRARVPRFTQAVWHPTGTFIVTGHEDSSLVVWDPKDGRKILARTLQATNVDLPGSSATTQSRSSTFAVKEPLFKIAWCAKENPDDTGLLIAGGAFTNNPDKGMTFMDLGPTPNYTTSSWQILSDHFEKPKRQLLLPTPPFAEVVDFCLIPRQSPYFAGSQDPIAVIALLASGAIITLSFPSGHPITPTNQLHVSLSYVHPFANRISMAYIARTQWLGMTEKRPRGPAILKGGAEQKRILSGLANRNIMQTAHADGVIRIWDVGHGDEIENGAALQVDVARAVGRSADVDIVHISMSGATGELAVGLRNGEVVIFRWGRNQYFGREVPHEEAYSLGLEAIKDRTEPGLKEGLLPLSLFSEQQGSVTALKTSDIGFIAAGFEGGSIAVIDLRGPAVIYNAGLSDVASKQGKRSSFRKSTTQDNAAEWPTCVEFGVFSLDGEDYSSICLFVGTNRGRLATFKLLPEPTGGYSVNLAGTTSVEDNILAISPIDVETGASADANQSIVADLRNGVRVNGTLLVVTSNGARIFKPAAAKGAHKSWDECICYSAATVRFGASGYIMAGLFDDGCLKAFSIPGLKEVSSRNISETLEVRRFSEAIITPTGEIIGWTGPSEIAVLNVWGNGEDLTRSLDKVFNPEALIPPRPTISNMQWLSGTSYVTPADMDKLIGGPDRPPSQRMVEQMKLDEKAQRMAARQASSASSSSAAPERSNEGYWAYMQRQVQERTENLGLTGESMNKLEDNSGGFAEDVSKFVSNQKRKAVMGVISSKLGL